MLSNLLRGTTALVCLPLVALTTAQDDPGLLRTLVLTPCKWELTFGAILPRSLVDDEEIKDRQASTIAHVIDSVPTVTSEGIENALDKDYVGHLSSPTRKAPGRTFKVSLTQSF